MPPIFPVLLCGGSGTRLWPVSRKSYPKQFVSLLGQHTMLQSAALRVFGQKGPVIFEPPLAVTGSDFRFLVTEQLQQIGIDPGAVLIEPEPRNTGPAILAAALYVAQQDPDAVLLIVPSDQIIPDQTAFHDAVEEGLGAVLAGNLVTFGVTPTRPEIGYGYLELAQPHQGGRSPLPLTRFVEKPDIDQAQVFLQSGRYLWNSGIFLMKASDALATFAKHAPQLMGPVKAAMKAAYPDLGFLRLGKEAWAQVEAISIDYAVMEKAENLSVVPFASDWSDLGSWGAVWHHSDLDKQGVARSGEVTALDCKNTLLRSEDPSLHLVGIGLQNIIAVAMKDAILVADMSCGEAVKDAVAQIQAQGVEQAEASNTVYRPWGWYEILVSGCGFQVKRILVYPGASLSLQSHERRAEHWVVVEGTAQVIIGDQCRRLGMNQSVYVPVGVVHRLENLDKEPVVLIEVQTGSYIGEDDILRYEDKYARIDTDDL